MNRRDPTRVRFLCLIFSVGSMSIQDLAMGQWAHMTSITSSEPTEPWNSNSAVPTWARFVTAELGLHGQYQSYSPSSGGSAGVRFTQDGGESWTGVGGVSGDGVGVGLMDVHVPTGTFYIQFAQTGQSELKKFVNGAMHNVVWLGHGFTKMSVVDTSYFFILRNVFSAHYLYKYENDILQPVDTLPHAAVDLKFLNDTLGFITARPIPTGPLNMILRTQNGGQDWEEMFSGMEVQIKKLSMPSYDHGYVLCENGVIAYTHDAGDTWTIGQISEHELNDMYFLNDTLGFVCGQNGVIMKTTDGAITWSVEEIDTNYSVEKIYFLADNITGMVNVGHYSTIRIYKRTEPVGIHTLSRSSTTMVQVWPNPSKRLVNVQSGYSIQQYELFSPTGQVLAKGQINASEFTLDLGGYSRNVYLLKLWSVEGGLTTTRICLVD